MKKARWNVVLSPDAEADFSEILQWTQNNFGKQQTRAYRATLREAITALCGGPKILGTKQRDDLGASTYTLHVARNGRKGRHFKDVAVVSDAEFDILRQFLELSSITSTAALGAIASSSIPINQDLFNRYLKDEVIPKYGTEVEMISGSFRHTHARDVSYFGIDCSLRHIKFTLWLCLYSNRVTACIGDSPDTPTKNMVADYFKADLSGMFPEMEIRNLRSSDYIILQKYQFVEGDNEDSAFTRFKELVDSVLEKILPELRMLMERKLPDVDRLLKLASDIKKGGLSAFPASSGWIVDGDFLSLHQHKPLLIYKEAWKGKFAIEINPEQISLNDLYFGLRRLGGSTLPSFGNIEDEVISMCKDDIFKENGRVYSRAGDRCIFYKQMPQEVRFSYKGSLLTSAGSFAYETPELTSQAAEKIVEVISRFKQMESKLDEMATTHPTNTYSMPC